MTATRSALFRVALLGLAAAALLPATAQAYWRGGVWFGLPGVYMAPPPLYVAPPPVYMAPPVYAAPPYAYAPAPSYNAPAPAQACYAGPWVCPLERPAAVGTSCACAGNGQTVWGQAN